MKNIPLLVATIVGTVILIVGVGWLFGKSGANSSAANQADRSLLENNLQLVKGDPQTAKVVVVEFSDFQCPACRASAPLVDQLANQYPDTVAFAYRYFPLESIHPNSFAAAVAAQAASVQGAFWPMHDKLFSSQSEWEGISDQNELAQTFIGYATSLGLDEAAFTQTLSDPSTAQAVNQDITMANQLKINATPTFFVNGVPVNAGELQQTIEQMLAESSNTVQVNDQTIEIPSASQSAQ